MHEPSVHFLTVFVAFFAVMNPIANAPLFLGLTNELDSIARRSIASRAVVFAFIIVSIFAVGGRYVFDLFGITLPAFRIAGGILVGLVGYHMLQGQHSSVHAPTEDDNAASRDAVLGLAITPLALPILAGPGTIATAMSFAAETSLSAMTRVIAAFAAICALTWAAFVGGETLVRFLGQNAIKVVSRLMGLILAVVGVQMLITGVQGIGPASQAPGSIATASHNAVGIETQGK
ncbi:MAG: MarC family protein [Chromatiaceae bacterium]|nr:MarC family protein [Chromatiaceae bacterium]MCP5315874.1 MarC family protein [Chromatiaceae bacterium]